MASAPLPPDEHLHNLDRAVDAFAAVLGTGDLVELLHHPNTFPSSCSGTVYQPRL